MQVEDLTHKSQFLEAELEKTSRQLKEATAMAQEEAEKNKAAQEVIRSLTSQVRDIILSSVLKFSSAKVEVHIMHLKCNVHIIISMTNRNWNAKYQVL